MTGKGWEYFDCRDDCDNANILDLLFERYASTNGVNKGACLRECYRMLNELWQEGYAMADVRHIIKTGGTLSEAKNTRMMTVRGEESRMGALLNDLKKLLEEIKEG